MHEIVTLQFGQQSNYLGTHFWNTQVDTLSRDLLPSTRIYLTARPFRFVFQVFSIEPGARLPTQRYIFSLDHAFRM